MARNKIETATCAVISRSLSPLNPLSLCGQEAALQLHQGRLHNQALGKDIVTGKPILYDQVRLCEFVLVHELGIAMLLQNTRCAIAVVNKTGLNKYRESVLFIARLWSV